MSSKVNKMISLVLVLASGLAGEAGKAKFLCAPTANREIFFSILLFLLDFCT